MRKKILPFVTTYHPALHNLNKHFNEQMALNLRSNTTVCGPWSAQVRDALGPRKIIKYFVEKKNTLNNEKYCDLLISILSYDEVSAFLLWVKTRN